MADELQLAQDWIYDTLSSDETLTDMLGGDNPRIFAGSVPSNTPFPFVMIEHISPTRGGTLLALGGDVVYDTALWRVTARIDKRSMKSLSAIISRFDSLLHRPRQGPFAVSGGSIQTSLRDPMGAYQRTVEEDGKIYSIKGREYIITAQAS